MPPSGDAMRSWGSQDLFSFLFRYFTAHQSLPKLQNHYAVMTRGRYFRENHKYNKE